MRISIGHRLFASVLLAILAVVATALVLMRHNVMNSFADYALSIELDRLDELSRAIASKHRSRQGWNFLPPTAEARALWIADELTRLQALRQAAPTPPMPQSHEPPPSPPVPPAMPAPPAPPAHPASPAPPARPVAPLAPLPPPLLAPAPPAPPAPRAPAEPAEPLTEELALQDRVTLLDASGAYLAGRSSWDAAGARRDIVSGATRIGTLAVARGRRPSDAMAATFLQQMTDSLPLILGASLMLSALAAMLLATHFRTPILRLAGGARELAEGRYDTRLPETRSDELGQLAHSFNQLAEKLGQAEAARRQWVADTSHELRTPLSVLRAQLEALQDGIRPASEEGTAAMLRQVLSLNKLIDELYALARADVGELGLQREALDLWQLATEQAHAFADKFAAASITFAIGASPAKPLRVSADPDRLRQVLANVFENCIRYCGPGTHVDLHPTANGICIDDDGPGVTECARARLGERFYRIEGSRSREHGGAGLGLALSQRIMQAHGGKIVFAQAPAGGLRVLLELPEAS